MKKFNKKFGLLALMFFLSIGVTFAQDPNAGAAGLTDAVGAIEDYFPVIQTLCYAIGGIIGLVGGIRIFNKWNSGDQDINKELIAYGGAMLFLVIAPNVVQSFFGL